MTNYRKYFQKQIDETPVITKERQHELIKGRMKADAPLNIDIQYPLGDRILYAVIYHPMEPSSVEIITVLESQIDAFSERYTYREDTDDKSPLPRFNEND